MDVRKKPPTIGQLLIHLWLVALTAWWAFAYHRFFGWGFWPQSKEELIADGLSILMTVVLISRPWTL